VHRDTARRADLRHPFAQCRDRDLAPDDDQRDQALHALELDQDQQRRADQELVRHRIEERAEGRGLFSLRARYPSAQSVSATTMNSNRGDEVALGLAQRQLEYADDQRDRDDARPGQQGSAG